MSTPSPAQPDEEVIGKTLRAERLALNASPAGERIEVLATGEVDAILAAVLETPPPGLDPTWFQDLAGRVSSLVVQVATMPEAAASSNASTR